MTLDLPGRHASRVHGDDLLVEARKPPLIPGDQLRVERAFPIARNTQVQLGILGQHRLLRIAIAVIGLARRRLAIEMVVQFRVQDALGQRFLQLVEKPILGNPLLRIAPRQKLVQRALLDRHSPPPAASLWPHTQDSRQSREEEAIVVAFRRHTLLSLDDCLYALQPTIPHLTRSSLHRCLQRHGIGRLVDIEGDKPAKKRFKSYPIGFFHIDIAEVQTAEGKLYLFVAIDRTSKFAFVQLVEKANRVTASAFLVGLVEAVPYKIHTVLTDNGIQFRLPPRHANGPTARYTTHMFDLRCREHGIEHRFTKINHPWTNGQVERMNRTIKDATVKRYHYDDHNQLRRHLADFVDAYNFGRRLKTLKGLTPFEFISKCWTSDPQRFKLNPLQQMPGLNN